MINTVCPRCKSKNTFVNAEAAAMRERGCYECGNSFASPGEKMVPMGARVELLHCHYHHPDEGSPDGIAQAWTVYNGEAVCFEHMMRLKQQEMRNIAC